MSEKIQITVNGVPAQVASGSKLLTALQDMGVNVPTLCHHRSLDANGACRLCVVEITHENWNGWSGLVTSCLYPVEPGLQVSTTSERVRQTRRTLLELYLARCPDSAQVKAVARAEGVDSTPFPIKENADSCIQCGQCTRVCNDLGPAAIAPLDRGTNKTVGPRPDAVGEDCVGCLACAEVCPTEEISYTLADGTVSIWNRDFDVAVCQVDPERCRGCGACEQACPFAIPRVAASRSGEFVATISPHTCTGCGICAGSCPTGAINQDMYPDSDLTGHLVGKENLRGKTITYACSRSPLQVSGDSVIDVSCVGRVGVDLILTCLARGADGVQLMCRDRDTCPYGAGGCLGEQHVTLAQELADYVGLGGKRIQYIRPYPCSGGPDQAVQEFCAGLSPSPLTEISPLDGNESTGLDRTLATVRWLKSRPELRTRLANEISGLFDVAAEATDVLYLDELPELDLLLSPLVSDWHLRDVLADAATLLKQKGLQVQLATSSQEVLASGAKRLIVFNRNVAPGFTGEAVTSTDVTDLGTGAGSGTGILAPDDQNAFRFRITPGERLEMIARLTAAGKNQTCVSPQEVAQIKLLTRTGSWQESLCPEPITAFSQALHADSGEND